MRTIINLLQVASCNNEDINEKNLYRLSGKPTKDITKQILDIIQNNNFKESFTLFLKIKEENNLFFISVLSELCELVITEKHESFHELVSIMSEIENGISYDGVEEIHIARFIALIKTI